METKRSTFKGSIGFVLAAAGSAVGLGNIWRFPYLAANGGGGLFLVIYIVLALTFGFTLLISEVSLGRKTKQGPLTAYGKLSKKWGWLGAFAAIVPFMILPYYCVIGGWVMKYMFVFIFKSNGTAATDDYFSNFIGSVPQPIIFTAVFLMITAIVISKGVNKGIENISKILMPILLILVIFISIFALTISNDDRSGLDGLKIYIIPSVKGMSAGDIIEVVINAMGQLFFSISVAMGIMVAYGSYFRDEDNLVKSVNQIEFFDTLIAFLAGVMIIPAVYVFMGREGMENSGAGLMFEAIPKVFDSMGSIGRFVGIAFFIMVFFAALTSSMSILEAVVSSLMDKFHMSRLWATVTETTIALVLGILVCCGSNGIIDFSIKLPDGSKADILGAFDYLSNQILMPILAIGTCILIGWIAKPKSVIDEATRNGEKFGRKNLYVVMIKYIAPVMLLALFVKSSGIYDLISKTLKN